MPSEGCALLASKASPGTIQTPSCVHAATVIPFRGMRNVGSCAGEVSCVMQGGSTYTNTSCATCDQDVMHAPWKRQEPRIVMNMPC